MLKDQHIGYTLRIELVGSKPPIWRRIGVDSQITLANLHHAIQAAFGWTDCHLHDFEIAGDIFGDPKQDPHGEMEFLDESVARLGQLVAKGAKFIYRYDFGDDWEHRIKVEAVEPLLSVPLSYAWLVAGKRACPPEDVGGIWGYEEFLEAINDPDSVAGQRMLEWVGSDAFDPAHFDLEEARQAVAEASRRRRSARRSPLN